MLTESLDKKNLESIFGKYNDEVEVMILSLNYCFGANTLKNLNSMLNGSGLGGNNIGFFFPESFDPWDEECFEEGVMFQWGIKGVVVDNQTFYKYLKKGVYEFVKLYPEKEYEALKILNNIKKKYNCSDECGEDVILKEITFDS